MIEGLNAVTLETADMARAVRFYDALGFVIRYGGVEATFTSFLLGGDQHLNLELKRGYEGAAGWGRIIFYVADVDALYRRVIAAGTSPSTAPADAKWGERYFHLSDPDGHELSFARLLA